MKKEQFLGLLRQLLTFAFTFLAMKGIGLEDTFADQFIAGALAVAVTVWGMADKTNNGFSAIYSLVRHLLSAAGALILGYEWLDAGLWSDLSSVIIGVFSVILSFVENKKVAIQKNGLHRKKPL